MITNNELNAEKERTEQTIAKEIARIRRDAVVLQPATVAMLDELPIAGADPELIKAWDGVLMPKGCYAPGRRSRILNMAPELEDRLVFLRRLPWAARVIRKAKGAGICLIDVEGFLRDAGAGRHTGLP